MTFSTPTPVINNIDARRSQPENNGMHPNPFNGPAVKEQAAWPGCAILVSVLMLVRMQMGVVISPITAKNSYQHASIKAMAKTRPDPFFGASGGRATVDKEKTGATASYL